jgi:biotin transport system substrate-specific component
LAQIALARTAETRTAAIAPSAALVVAFSFFIAATAQISIPFYPVPLTGQTLGVLLAGAVLGWRLGVAAVVLYLAESLMGLPVLSSGRNAWTPTPTGVPYILGSTLGYLVGFVVAAGVVGWLAERAWDRSVAKAAAAMVLGNAVIYLFGVAWLTRFVPIETALVAGFTNTLIGDAVKIAIAAAALPGAWALLGRRSSES